MQERICVQLRYAYVIYLLYTTKPGPYLVYSRWKQYISLIKENYLMAITEDTACFDGVNHMSQYEMLGLRSYGYQIITPMYSIKLVYCTR